MADVDFLAQLADYMADNGLGNTDSSGADATIFVGFVPSEGNRIIALLGNNGPKPSVDVPDIQYPSFQVIVRSDNYEGGAGTLRAVRTLLHDRLAVSLSNFYCWRIQADSEGGSIGQDDKGRHEFSINFTAEVRYGDSI